MQWRLQLLTTLTYRSATASSFSSMIFQRFLKLFLPVNETARFFSTRADDELTVFQAMRRRCCGHEFPFRFSGKKSNALANKTPRFQAVQCNREYFLGHTPLERKMQRLKNQAKKKESDARVLALLFIAASNTHHPMLVSQPKTGRAPRMSAQARCLATS